MSLSVVLTSHIVIFSPALYVVSTADITLLVIDTLSPAVRVSCFPLNAVCRSVWFARVHPMSPHWMSFIHSNSNWLELVAMNLNCFTAFAANVVPYPFGLVIPVHSVIVYTVLHEFTLSTYSIPAFSSVPAATVKFSVGVNSVDMLDIVKDDPVATFVGAKSE